MQLLVKKGDKTVRELRQDSGTIRIGRRSSNDISLADPKVSKHHAVISTSEDGKWSLEDLDSPNKTYLNGKAIHKADLKTGDKISIGAFTLEVSLEEASPAGSGDLDVSQERLSEFDELDIGDLDVQGPEGGIDELDLSDIELSDLGSSADRAAITAATTAETEMSDSALAAASTAQKLQADSSQTRAREASRTGITAAETGLLMVAPREPQIIVRKIGAEKAPPVRFDSDRMVEFLQVVDAVNRADSVDAVLLALLEAVERQFGSCYTWCALRSQSGGPMTSHGGRQRDGRPLDFAHIPLNEKINQSIEKGEFLLLIFSRDMDLEKGRQVRSALIAPVLDSSGCYGAIYVNNTFRDEHYDLGDLDYLMIITIHTATVLQKLQAT